MASTSPQAGPSLFDQVQQSSAPLQPGAGGGAVEVDDDSSSDYSLSESSTATTSVTSSVFNFTYANGRRYHSDRFKSNYFMPNDEKEQERLDFYHHIFSLLLGGKLFTAPLDNPQAVLDVGTGTGIWAIDFADENPQAKVIGTDISPIQPSWVPPNCTFEVDDLEENWTYDDNYFDYIHIRSMSGCFGDWSKFLKQAYRTTAPGGYIELQEYSSTPAFLCDGTVLRGVNDEHPVSSYLHYISQAFEKRGVLLDVGPRAKELLQDAGFVDIVEHTAIWPIGHWPKDKRLKDIGRFARIGSEDSLYPFGLELLTSNGWEPEQVAELCEKVKESFAKADKKGNGLAGKYYFQAWFVYGRKPLKDEEC